MAERTRNKTVFVKPETHAALGVLAQLDDCTITDLVEGALGKLVEDRRSEIDRFESELAKARKRARG